MDTTFSHIKAVFCDIDGTLLTSQHTVSPRTVAAIRALREPQPKVMFTMAPEVMPRVIERASTFADDTVKAAALQTTQRLYEFMDPRVSKTRGLVRVAELNDMGLQDICVFGDADNDTCMVADAGVGVAMANGSDATRFAADFVTASNDKDGIAFFIEEHLL